MITKWQQRLTPGLVFLFTLMAFLVAGCGSQDQPAETKTKTEAGSTPAPAAPTTADNETKAVAELCGCFNSAMANMNPRVKRLIIDAGKSDNPLAVLAAGLLQAESLEERERLEREFEQFQNNPQLQQCSDDVQKKYGLNETDTASQRRVVAIAAGNAQCEVVYALLKIGLAQQAMPAPPPGREP